MNISLSLTLLRLTLSPVLMPLLILYARAAAPVMFLLLSVTDYFDGYYARKLKQESVLGQLLDPVADKLLIFSTTTTLLWLHELPLWWLLMVICRDIWVMGLREVALSKGFAVPVAYVGKLKTTVQVIYVLLVLVPVVPALTLLAAYGSGVLTLFSGIVYTRDFWEKYRQVRAF